MANRLARWRELDSQDRLSLLGLMTALPAVEALVSIFGVFRTKRWIERFLTPGGAGRSADQSELQAAEQLARLAAIAGRRGVVTATCLRQALLIYGLLLRRGLSPQFRIGVRKDFTGFDAHAWVELEGVALGQPNLKHKSILGREEQPES